MPRAEEKSRAVERGEAKPRPLPPDPMPDYVPGKTVCPKCKDRPPAPALASVDEDAEAEASEDKGAARVTSTRGRVRYMKCTRCGSRFKSVEVAKSRKKKASKKKSEAASGTPPEGQ